MATITLKVITDITSEKDFFDNLIEVIRLDTNEQGTILCSHCCYWPKEKVEEATWLEGCFTPESYENDERLLLGYHHNKKTDWKVQKTLEGEVLIHLSVDDFIEENWVVGIPFFAPLTPCEGIDPKPSIESLDKLQMRLLRRIWSNACRGRSNLSSCYQAFFATAIPAIEQGMVTEHHVRMVVHCILNEDEEGIPEIVWQQTGLTQLAEYIGCSVVVVDDIANGFAKALSFAD